MNAPRQNRPQQNRPQQPVAVAADNHKTKLVTKFADRYSVDPDKLLSTLKSTAFRQRDANKVVTNEQMMALLVVADQYGLNPFTKEIFAFEDKGNIIPVVSVDGWSRIINSHNTYDGIEFNYSETMATIAGGKPCPEWCEAVIHHKDRGRPTIVREYLDEVYVPPRNGYTGPWQTHTKRMLRHKALIQGARVAFGFGGIYDEDEAMRITEAVVVQSSASATGGGANVGDLAAALKQRDGYAAPIDAEFTDPNEQSGAADAAAPEAAHPSEGAAAEPTEPVVYDPASIAKDIEDCTTDAEVVAILPDIEAWKSEDVAVYNDLMRKALAKRTAVLSGAQ